MESLTLKLIFKNKSEQTMRQYLELLKKVSQEGETKRETEPEPETISIFRAIKMRFDPFRRGFPVLTTKKASI